MFDRAPCIPQLTVSNFSSREKAEEKCELLASVAFVRFIEMALPFLLLLHSHNLHSMHVKYALWMKTSKTGL